MVKSDNELWLFTVEEFKQLPDGTFLESIYGSVYIKGEDFISMDTRNGYLAYGVRNPTNHCLGELFTKFQLTQ